LAGDGRLCPLGSNISVWGDSLATIEIYDPTTGIWSAGAEAPPPMAGAPAGVADVQVSVISGYLDGKNQAPVQAYDPATDSWSARAETPTRRNFPNTAHEAVSCPACRRTTRRLP
jgi:hypothetical protein